MSIEDAGDDSADEEEMVSAQTDNPRKRRIVRTDASRDAW